MLEPTGASSANDEQNQGVIEKYLVRRNDDPTGKHDDCWFFVLDPQHDPLAQPPRLPPEPDVTTPASGAYKACDYRMKRAWWCSRRRHHDGPCALRPRWWNLSGRRWMR